MRDVAIENLGYLVLLVAIDAALGGLRFIRYWPNEKDKSGRPKTDRNRSLAYRATPLRIINNGHAVQVNYAPGSTLTVRDRTYQIVQFHFHTPTEHAVDGKHFPLEMHVVHADANKDVAVLGVFFAEGETNRALDPVWSAAPAKAGPERQVTGVSVNAASLVPSTTAYFEYLGSLTTPPCSEDIKWLILANANHASSAQIATFEPFFRPLTLVSLTVRHPEPERIRAVLDALGEHEIHVERNPPKYGSTGIGLR